LEYSRELNEEQKALDQFKKDVLQLAETFQKIELDTERLQKAKAHFDQRRIQRSTSRTRC
jgi:hypothetical protein